MRREELVSALRRMMPENGSLRCLGCGYEHNCSLHGCAIIREAMEEIMRLAVENEALRRGSDAPGRPLSQAERDALLEWPPDPLPNPPLTLEELRGMEGGPSVWVSPVKENSKIPARYMLVSGYNPNKDIYIFTPHANIAQGYDGKSYGKTWLAFRRKPEEGTAWQQ